MRPRGWHRARISNCAEWAGIAKADIGGAVQTAEAAGFLVVHVSEPTVMITAKGIEAARQPGTNPAD